MPLRLFRRFIQLESASSIILFAAALFALLLANSPWQTYYQTLLSKFSVELVINDGLMTLFFLLVSLEIKRELLIGELNTRTKALLPGIAAIGGMIVPALIFVGINFHHPQNLKGWGIPTATDIAFSLGILSLLGKRIPTALKVFLTALAIIDDLGAIIIIALFYSQQLHYNFLGYAVLCMCGLLTLNYYNIHRAWPYVILGLVLWICVLQSGVHATIAGVLLGLVIPLRSSTQPALLNRLEQQLHSWVAYGILPLFAFANAGLSFHNLSLSTLCNPLTLGIAAGLLLGKPIGVYGASWLAVKANIARLPQRVTWRQLYGVAVLCGMGFTMSLFIGGLAFPGNAITEIGLVKLGVIVGSGLAGVLGYVWLRVRH